MIAQVGGQGPVTGTVTDLTGAVIPNASVTAVNVATGVTTVRAASSSGVYSLNPLLPGTYTISVSSAGFSSFKQENVVGECAFERGSECHPEDRQSIGNHHRERLASSA